MAAVERRTRDLGLEGRRARPFQWLLRPEVLWSAAAAGILVLASTVLYRMSGEIRYSDIETALSNVAPWQIGLAIGLTFLSFLGMGLYDIVASRCVAPGKVPARLAAFAGMTGYALSNALGFHMFVGGPVRYRIYASTGLDAADVGRIVGIAFGALWLGFAALFGLVLLFDPNGFPALQDIAPKADRMTGALLLAGLAALTAWVWRAHQSITIFRWRMPLPGGPVTLMLILLGILDVAAAAGVLYVLLPADLRPEFATFIALFTLALIAGTASHVPGGLGVLEATCWWVSARQADPTHLRP